MSKALVAARPLTEDDGEALRAVDQAYALRHELEPALTRSSLAFFLRSGHAFAAYRGSEPQGFALAQAIWNGTRPTVYLSRLAATAPARDHSARTHSARAHETDPNETAEVLAAKVLAAKVLAALVQAVTKSAYDAAVYDLIATVPEGDRAAASALDQAGYHQTPLRLYSRVLGTRGQSAPP